MSRGAMGLLLKSKSEVDRLLGKPALAPGLLALTRDGEKAWRYRRGDLEYTADFLDGVARYLLVTKASGGPFGEADVWSVLTSELGMNQWTITPSYKEAPEKPVENPKKGRAKRLTARLFSAQRPDADGKNIVANYLGWLWGTRGHLFLATPYAENLPPLPIDHDAIRARAG